MFRPLRVRVGTRPLSPAGVRSIWLVFALLPWQSLGVGPPAWQLDTRG